MSYSLGKKQDFGVLVMKAVLSKKGQIVIPKAIRDRFGLKEGDVLDVFISDRARKTLISLKPKLREDEIELLEEG